MDDTDFCDEMRASYAKLCKSPNSSMTNHPKTRQVLNDKIFQYFFHKTFHTKECSDYLNFTDKDKVNFLTELYLFVSKDFETFSNTLHIQNDELNFSKEKDKDISKLPVDILQKIDSLRKESSKKTIYQTMEKLNIIQSHSLSGGLTPRSENVIEDGKDDIRAGLQKILSKYHLPKSEDFEKVQQEVKVVIKEKEKEMQMSSSLIKYLRNDHQQDFKSSEPRLNNPNTFINMCIPSTRAYVKVDYHNVSHFPMEEIKSVQSYVLDNTELILHLDVGLLSSYSNGLPQENQSLLGHDFTQSTMRSNQVDFSVSIGSNSMIIQNPKTRMEHLINKESDYKIVTNPSKRSNVDALGFVLFNHAGKKSALKKTMSKTVINYDEGKKIHEIILVNQPISEHTEMIIEKQKKKNYLGKDTVDKIFFCPNDNIVVLDYNETTQLGALLLEFLRLEESYYNLKHSFDFQVNEISAKHGEEEQRLISEITRIKDTELKRTELVDKYSQMLGKRFDICTNRLINENESVDEDVHCEVMKEINQKIEKILSQKLTS